MITLLITALLFIIPPIIICFIIIYHYRKAQKHREELESIRTAMNARDRMREHLLGRRNTDQIRMRERIDRDRLERGLQPIYGPNGIRTIMRNEDNLIGGINIRVTGEQENLMSNIRICSREGDTKTINGVNYIFKSGRWVFINKEMIDFLTDEDVVIE